MRARFLAGWLAAAVLALAFFCSAAAAQQAELSIVPELSAKALQERIEVVQGAEHLEAAEAEKLLERYRAAAGFLEQAASHENKAVESERATQAAPQLLKELRAQPEPPPVEVKAPDEPLPELVRRLTEAEADLTAARKRLEALKDEETLRQQRRAEIPDLQAAARQRLQQVDEQLAAADMGESPAAAAAVTASLMAEKRMLTAVLNRYEKELRSYDARSELLEARKVQAAEEVARASQVVQRWEQIVQQRRQTEARAAATEAADQIEQVPPELRTAAERNEELALLRSEVTGKLPDLASRLDQLREAVQNWQDRLSEAGTRLSEAGLTRAVGAFLRAERAELPELTPLLQSVRSRRKLLADVEFRLFQLREQLKDLQEDMDRAVRRLMDQVEVPAQRRATLRETAIDLLEQRRAVLGKLVEDYDRYLRTLQRLQETESRLIEVARQYRSFIDANILWLRSTSALGLTDVQLAAKALGWLANPANWAGLADALQVDARDVVALYAAVLLLAAVLTAMRGRFSAALRASAQKLNRSDTDSVLHTLKALGLTVLIPLPVPLLLLFVGWRLTASVEVTEFARSVGTGLVAAGLTWLTIGLLRVGCREGGLADRHFRWRTRPVLAFRSNLGWLLPALLPGVILAAVFRTQTNELWTDSMGRIALVYTLVVTAVFVQRILRFKGGVLQETLARRQESWLNRLRWLWYLGAIAVPLALAGGAAAGYHYTGIVLSLQAVQTLWLLGAVVIVYELLLRWLFVERRRLALEQARKRREEEQTQRKAAAEAEEPAPEMPPLEEPEVSLYAIGAQTQQLLHSLLWIAVFVVLWAVWSDVLPALGKLKNVQLESNIPITLGGVGIGIVVVVVTILAAKNIPGLLEIAVLQHLPLEQAVRFAITTVSRYAIVLVGVVLAFSSVGVKWEHLQWLVAAISVGLGFGLQEIFANFVSGLIILFERPMRVGDTVTVGDVTGTVSRIRIRATTIVDWDRKELVVPNKEFITGRLVNWTLSDRILRVIVPVGIAYGSDTDKARRTLRRLAQEHPAVLDEPEPTVLFMGFGDSTLNFELRVFVPSVEQRLRVTDELTTAIDDAFRQEGIEIAFPQQDVHIRTIRAPLQLRQDEETGRQGSE